MQQKQIKKANKDKESDTGPYKILIGVSKSKTGKPEGIVLTTTDKIPLEGSPVEALERVSESRWFWIEIDKKKLNHDAPNYVQVWSEDEELNGIEVAPIVAAGIGSNKRENSFLVKGENREEIKTIKFFEPALAIKLVGKTPPVPKIEINNLFLKK